MSVTFDEIAHWVEQSRRGDQNAFARLVGQYQGMVSGIALSRLGDLHQSEDLAQETFLVAWQKLHELEDAEKFPGWICSIARNLARNLSRKRVQTERTGLGLETATTASRPDTDLIRAEQNALIVASMQKIPERYREALVLFYRADRSIAEIAQALDITEEAARKRLSRARKHLRHELEKQIGHAISHTSPGDAFTLAVIAALPGMVLHLAPRAVEAATLSDVAQTAGGMAGGAGKNIFGAPFFYAMSFFASILACSLLIMIPGVSRFWGEIRNAPTLLARRWMVQRYMTLYALSLLFAFFLLFTETLLPDHRSRLFPVVLVEIGVLVLLLRTVLHPGWKRDWNRIIHVEKIPDDWSFSKLMWLFSTIGVSVIILLILYFKVKPYQLYTDFKPMEMFWLTAVVILLCHVVFCLFTFDALRISRNEDRFQKTPPLIGDATEVARGIRPKPASWPFGERKSDRRGLFLYDLTYCILPFLLGFFPLRLMMDWNGRNALYSMLVFPAALTFSVIAAYHNVRHPHSRRTGFAAAWVLQGGLLVALSFAIHGTLVPIPRSGTAPEGFGLIALVFFLLLLGLLFRIADRTKQPPAGEVLIRPTPGADLSSRFYRTPVHCLHRILFWTILLSVTVPLGFHHRFFGRMSSRTETLPNGFTVRYVHVPGCQTMQFHAFVPFSAGFEGPDQAGWSDHVKEGLQRISLDRLAMTLVREYRGVSAGNGFAYPVQKESGHFLQVDSASIFYEDNWLVNSPVGGGPGSDMTGPWTNWLAFGFRNLDPDTAAPVHRRALCAWNQVFRHGKDRLSFAESRRAMTQDALLRFCRERIFVQGESRIFAFGGEETGRFFERIRGRNLDKIASVKAGFFWGGADRRHNPMRTRDSFSVRELRTGSRTASWDLEANVLVLTWPIPEPERSDDFANLLLAEYLLRDSWNGPEPRELGIRSARSGCDFTTPEERFFYLSLELAPDADRKTVEAYAFSRIDSIVRRVRDDPVFCDNVNLSTYVVLGKIERDGDMTAFRRRIRSFRDLDPEIGSSWAETEFRFRGQRTGIERSLKSTTPQRLRETMNKYLSPASSFRSLLITGPTPP